MSDTLFPPQAPFIAWIRHHPVGQWLHVAEGTLDECWRFLLAMPAANVEKTVLPSGQSPTTARKASRRPGQ